MLYAQKIVNPVPVAKVSQHTQQAVLHDAPTFQFKDNRSTSMAQHNLQSLADVSYVNNRLIKLQAKADTFSLSKARISRNELELNQTDTEHVQLKPVDLTKESIENTIQRKNITGMPDTLKSGVENLSGIDMSDVKVHYNSSQPAQLNAHAYAQGTNIHIAPGQEKHLPHEAWHVVQQKQGRVKPTMQMKKGIAINDDEGLEKEADVMGAKAISATTPIIQKRISGGFNSMNISLSESCDNKVASLVTGTVIQNYFTAEGEKQHKIRAWKSITKTKLRDNGEELLLALFVRLDKSEKKVPWDIRESYTLTILNLREKLDDENENGVITTILDEEHPTKELKGVRSGTGYKRLAAWDLDNALPPLDPLTHTEISHVSKKGDWMSERIDAMHGAEKGELGPGFYTVSGHDEIGSKGIRDEFGEDGKEPRDVLKFRIDNVELAHLVGDNVPLAQFLIYVLQHQTGYPPNFDPIASITAINKLGHVLIFPDKTTAVDVDSKGTKHSYESYRGVNGSEGNHSLIIGPQARQSLNGIRQICARGYLGDKLLNEAPRSLSRLGPRNS